MPLVVFVLSAAVFAQGTSEFMLSGLLEEIAADTGVSIGTAGLLTSLFAVGMVIGAPTMAVAVSKIPQRAALIGFPAMFCGAHIVGALTTNFALLLCTRVAAAIANAGFLAVALASLPALVPQAAIGRATSMVLSGVTLACIVGVPAGTLLGQARGWHSAFWAIAIITAVALMALWATPANIPAKKGRPEWRAFEPRLILLGVLVNAATFASFTYLGTITARLTSPDSVWVPVALALFGLGSFAGVTIAGRHSGIHFVKIGIPALAALWLAATFTTNTLPGLLVTAFATGAGAFGIGSTLIAALVQATAGAVATTAFNLGAVLGPAVAGLVVGESAHAALWVSFGFTAVAALIAQR